MINGSTSRHSLFAALLFSLAACSSSDPDTASTDQNADSPPDTSLPADQPTTPEDDNTATPPATSEDPDNGPVGGDAPSDDSVDMPDDTGVSSPGDAEPETPPAPLTPPPAPGANPDNQPPEQTPGDPGQEPPGDDTDPVEPPSDSSDPVEQPDDSNPPLIGGPPAPGGLPVADNPPATDPTPLVPPVISGSDLDQLIEGLTREASTAILFLNARISQGSLTADQNDCLGAYEPGNGRQLTGFDCGNQYLEQDGARLLLTQAAFFDTTDCQASLFNASSEGCILEKLSMTVPADWSEAPELGYPGAEVRFAIGDTSLRIESDGQALQGMFSCEINLETALPVSGAGIASSCDSIVSQLVREIDRIQDR